MASEIQRVEKPWGHELIWARTDRYVGKILVVNRGQKLSLQFHRVKDESIFLNKGRMTLLLENGAGKLEEIRMKPGEARHIPPGRRHRFMAEEDCEIFEVSTPELDDVVRIEDSYGRAAGNG